MIKNFLNLFCIAMFGLCLVAATPVFAEESSLPKKPQEQSSETESIQPDVKKQTEDQAAENRKKIIAEAKVAIDETKKALNFLDSQKTDEALKALEIATGKLEIILARDPELALAPVDVEVITHDMLASLDTVKAMIYDAEEYLEDGEVQKARALIANLASETVFHTISIPLASYPDAIKASVALIDEGKIDEAKAGLQRALNTLVVTRDNLIPLPLFRAKELLKKAEKLAENKNRTAEDNETLENILKEARNHLKMGQLLGYAPKKSFKPLYDELDKIEQKTSGGKGGKGWFGKIKELLSKSF